MKIELRKVEYSARLSQETAAFAADIWIDGFKEGEARNDGHGGPTLISPGALSHRLDQHGKTLPAETIAGDPPFVLQPDGKWIVGGLLQDWIARRELKRLLKNKLLYTRTDRPGLFQTKILTPIQKASVLASPKIRADWNVDVFLNAVPDDEAFKLYRQDGAG